MTARLEGLFEGIAVPEADGAEKPIYAVAPISGYESYFVGKDREGHACLLASTSDPSGRQQSPIRLENLDAQFDIRCHLRRKADVERVGTFTVIRCRAVDPEIVRYFLSVAEVIVAIAGDKPRQRELASAIHRLAAIFQRMQKPPSRPVNGLFGELFVIWRSKDASKCLSAWRLDDTARFDFATGDIRIEVKTASGRLRVHDFSYDQCNPPPGTHPVAISLFVERSPGGISLRSLIREIETRISGHPDLVLKLHEVVAATLGMSMSEALTLTFDAKLAGSSLRIYGLRDVPAIRGALPVGVSDVHFRSDISSLPALNSETLSRQNEAFSDLLPEERN
jgi:hypothetical protein